MATLPVTRTSKLGFFRAAQPLLYGSTMPSNTPTLRPRSKMSSVVVVHDDPRQCSKLHEALRNQHVVHVARDIDEMIEELGTATRLACIVCVASQKTDAVTVRDHAVLQGAPAERIVFIGKDDLLRPEMLERTARVAGSFRP